MTVGVFEFYHNFHWISPGVRRLFLCLPVITHVSRKKCCVFLLFFYGPPSPTYAHNLKTINFWMSLKLLVEDCFFFSPHIDHNFSYKSACIFSLKKIIFFKQLKHPLGFFGIDVSCLWDLFFGLSQYFFLLLKTLSPKLNKLVVAIHIHSQNWPTFILS